MIADATTDTPAATVFVVDDDQAVCKSLSWLIESVGLPVRSCYSAREFLEVYDPTQPACVLLDVRMPGMSGLELQQRLFDDGIRVPVIVMTGHGDVAMAVRAMKCGAVDFVEKPFNDQLVLDLIQQAIAKDIAHHDARLKRETIAARLRLLTAREKEVMDLVVAGKSNKDIAGVLELSAKTVEAHRNKVMMKMEATSLAELVQMSWHDDR